MSTNVDLNNRPDYDTVLQDIADYVLNFKIQSAEALDTARNCLMDTLGCGLLALRFPDDEHLGPIVEGTVVPFGAARPRHQLSPRSGQSGVGHRLHRPLARLQRHLARR